MLDHLTWLHRFALLVDGLFHHLYNSRRSFRFRYSFYSHASFIVVELGVGSKFKADWSRMPLHQNSKNKKAYWNIYGPTSTHFNKIPTKLTVLSCLHIIFFHFQFIFFYCTNPWTFAIHDQGSFQTFLFHTAFSLQLLFFL